MSDHSLAEPRSPGRTWWWVGGILLVVGVVLVVAGFVAPFLAFPFDTMSNPDAPPDPEEISRAVGATFAGVGAVFGGFLAGAVGVALLIVGFVKHSNWRNQDVVTGASSAPPPAGPVDRPPPPPRRD